MRPKSKRQAAIKTGIPVSQRVQHRLVKELSFVGPADPVTNKAVEKFVGMFNEELPPRAVAALRKATRLDIKPLGATLAAVASAEEHALDAAAA